MFNEEFYPTPKALIQKMLEPFYSGKNRFDEPNYSKLAYKTILDPQAGKCDILDFIKNLHIRDVDLNAIELNQDLQSIIKDKGYPLLAEDFLTYHENCYWDLIIMNPPFSNGDEHLLHAISLGRNTDIICLLNAETIKNPYSKTRKMLVDQIEMHNGTIEYIENGFVDAERKTNVEIALVRLFVEVEEDNFSYDFDKEPLPNLNFDFDIENNTIARKDLIGNMNKSKEIVMALYKEKLKSDAKFFHFLKSMTDVGSYYSDDSYILKSGTHKQMYNHLSKNLKKFMWKEVIKELDVTKYMSSKVEKNFEAYIDQQKNIAFTKENVAKFFQFVMTNRIQIWENAIVDIFDVLTRYDEDNRHHVEGWKTNDKYKINRRIILPYWVEWQASYDDASWMKTHGKNFSLRHNRDKQYTDIDKVLSYIAGHHLPHWSTIDFALEKHFKELGRIRTGDKFDNKTFSGYFDIKFYKKGTVHLYFKDKKLWDEFNMRACAGKDWLPGPEKRMWEEELKRRRNKKEKEEAQEEIIKIGKPQIPTLFDIQ